MGLVVAVDIFLVISGFALTLLTLRVGEKYGHIYVIIYFFTRIKRLIPALLVMLTVVVLVLVFLIPLGAGDSRQTIDVANGAVLFIANIVVDNSLGGYFGEDLFTKQNPLVHMWGLSVEEQIFIVFPFIMLFILIISKRVFPSFKKNIIIVFGALSVISFSFIYLALAGMQIPFMSDNASSAIYLSVFTRFWEFAAGVIMAVLMYRNYKVKLPVLSGVTGGLLVVAVMLYLSPGDIYPSAITILLIIGICLILYAGSSGREASSRNPLTFRPLTFIGDISYPWFLWHMPFIIFAFALFERNFWIGLVAGLLAGIPAFLSDRFLEKPVFNSKFLSIKKTFILFPVAVAGFLTFTHFVITDDLVNKVQPWSWTNHEAVKRGCQLPESLPENCTWGNTYDSAKTLVLVGDSLAMTVGTGAVKAAEEAGWRVTIITGFNCPFTPDVPSGNLECDSISKKALNFINETSPDAVMIVNAYTDLEVGLSNSRIADKLNAQGIEIIVSDGSTEGDKYSGKQTTIFRKGGMTRYKEPPNISPFAVKIYNDIASKYNSVSVHKTLCVDGNCLTAKDGVEYYSDDRHLSPQGAELLAPAITDILRKIT